MELKELQQNWDAFGKRDPLWAILTHPEKKFNKWDRRRFFQSGEVEIRQVLEQVAALPFSVRRGTALDFGCGIGRLTQALCRHFQNCHGIDIAPSMIEQARACNDHGKRCQYHVNGRDDLGVFPDGLFDFIYSNIVLQHMRPEYSSRYIREFIRVLSPGGMLVFQIPGLRQPDTDLNYRAVIRTDEESLLLRVGGSYTFAVRVKNVSDFTWPEVRLGNHWFRPDWELVRMDDGRTSIPAGLAPGQEVELSLTVYAPPEPGPYSAELDIVHELVTWFKDRGSSTVLLPAQVLPASRIMPVSPRQLLRRLRSAPGYRTAARLYRKVVPGKACPPPVPDPTGRLAPELEEHDSPVMEMHGIPKEDVVSLIRDCGAQVLQIHRDCAAGREWQSFRYYVTKP